MTSMDLISLWVGRGTLLIGAIGVLFGLLYFTVSIAWSAIRLTYFGARVLKAGFISERERVRGKRLSA